MEEKVASKIDVELTITKDGLNSKQHKISVQSSTDNSAWKQFRQLYEFLEGKKVL